MTENLKLFTEEQLKVAKTAIDGFVEAKALNVPNEFRLPKFNDSAMLHTASHVRNFVWNYPVLNGALFIYQQIASSREWQVSGKPRAAHRAVEWLNHAESRNPVTGQIDYGFESFQKRRVIDYVTVGRTALGVKGSRGSLQYLDPTRLTFQPIREARWIRDDDVIWAYPSAEKEDLRFQSKEVFLTHPLPIGNNGFIAPVMLALPMATLAALLHEHDNNTLDGRKIRDIMLVNTGMAETLHEAVQASAALHMGESVADVGVPVVPVNNLTGQAVKDMFSLLGLSQMPENFERSQFMTAYANVIAAVLGLSVRHFWSDSTGSNKALETVQEARQQQKGPAAYIRAEQRLMNTSGILKRFTSDRVEPRFGFIEEADLATKKANANMIQSYATAAEKMKAAIGAEIKPESFIGWLQDLGLLDYDMELVENPEAGVSGNDEGPSVVTEGQIGGASGGDGQVRQSGDKRPSTLDANKPNNEKTLRYDEISVDQNGRVIERRRKVFSLFNYFVETSPTEKNVVEEPSTVEVEEIEDPFEKSLNDNVQFVLFSRTDKADIINKWKTTHVFYTPSDVDTALELAEKGVELDSQSQAIINTLADHLNEVLGDVETT